MAISRITVDEAQQYIPCNEDFTGGIENAAYFTLTPMEDDWDKVTYYTARKINMYANRGGAYDSWVYIMSNPTMPGYYKIGYTKNTPEERARQISNATGVIVPMKVEWAFHCYNGYALEQEVHHKLDTYRVNNHREFFQIPLEEAKQTVTEIGERYI